MSMEPERFLVSWFTVKKSGLDRPHWLDILRDYGCEVDGDSAPCYSDTMPRKPKNGTVVFEMFDDLSAAIRSMRAVRGIGKRGCLVVPHFGHFGSAAVWEKAAVKVAELDGLVIDAASGTVLDGHDIGAGIALIKRSRGRVLTAGRKIARSRVGRPKITLGGARFEEALKLFGDPNWSIPVLTNKFGFKSQMTFLRRIEEVTGTVSKAVAVYLADHGRWPPKRKLTPAALDEIKAKAGLF